MNIDPLEFIRLYGWYLGTFVYAVLSGAIPVLNCEVFLLVLAMKAPREMLFPLIVTTTLGQMVAKSLLYWAGRGVLRLPGGARVENVLASLGCKVGAGWRAAALVFASAVIGTVVVGVVVVVYALRKARTKPEAGPPVTVAPATAPPAVE
jgi:hypothetical protein